MVIPQCEISTTIAAQELLFISGGRSPNLDWLRDVAGGRKIFCVDKGIEVCRACELVPNFLIGDFDSASKSAVDWAQKKNPRRKISLRQGFDRHATCIESRG